MVLLDSRLTWHQITYDLHQLPNDALLSLRDSLLQTLQLYIGGPRPIRTQLCVCIASLAIQILSWKDVLSTVGAAVGTTTEGGDTMLDFLRILPEEVTEGRKVNLSVCSTIQHFMRHSTATAPLLRISV
jgi:transportin-3